MKHKTRTILDPVYSFFRNLVTSGSTKAVKLRRISLLVLLVVFFSAFPAPSPILSGWDTFAHQALLGAYSEKGPLSGEPYTIFENWGYGLPFPDYYYPLPYTLFVILDHLTFRLFSVGALLLLMIKIFALITIHGFYRLTGVLFGKQHGKYGALAGFFYVFFPGSLMHWGVGFDSAVNGGLFAQFMATALLLHAVSAFLQCRSYLGGKAGLRAAAFLGILTAAVALSHYQMFMALILFYLVAIIVFRKDFLKNIKPILLAGTVAAVLAGPHFLYMMKTNSFSAATSAMAISQGLQDPLLAFFDSIASILMLLVSLYAMVLLIRKKEYYLPVFFFIFLFLINRNILPDLLRITVHYYRFTNVFLLITLLMGGYGLSRLVSGDILSKTYWFRYHEKKRLLAYGFAVFLLFIPSIGIMLSERKKTKKLDPKKVINWQRAADYIARSGRRVVLGEHSRSFFKKMGIMHPILFFAFNNNLFSSDALLAESTISTPFIKPLNAAFNGDFFWGYCPLAGMKSFLRQPFSIHMKRMESLGIQWLIGSSRNFTSVMKSVKPDKRFGEVMVFNVTTNHAYISRMDTPRVAYFGPFRQKKTGFQQLAMFLFGLPGRYDSRVVYLGNDPKSIDPEILKKFYYIFTNRDGLARIKDKKLYSRTILLYSGYDRIKRFAPILHKLRATISLDNRRKLDSYIKEIFPGDHHSDNYLNQSGNGPEYFIPGAGWYLLRKSFHPYLRLSGPDGRDIRIYPVSPFFVGFRATHPGKHMLGYSPPLPRTMAFYLFTAVFLGFSFIQLGTLLKRAGSPWKK